MTVVHVTGARGFIGRQIVSGLRTEGYEVSCSDVHAGDGVMAIDLRDRNAVLDMIGIVAPDVVIHGGAISGAMLAQDDPTLMFDVNVSGTLNIAEAMRRAGCRRLVFLSSNSVYADAETREFIEESAPLGASDAYGASKIAAEAVLAAYAAGFDLNVLALRVSSVFGAGRTTPYLISEALEAVRAGRPITVTDARSNMRQFVHVTDVVRAVLGAVRLETPGFTPINVTGGTYLSEEQIVRLLLGERAESWRVAVIPDGGRNDDGRVGPLSIARAQALLGYVPSIDIAEALKELGEPIVSGRSPAA